MKTNPVCVLTSILLISSLQLSARTWTDVQGREIVADYVSHNDKELVMRLVGGREATVPLERLSKADREFLENLDKRGKGPEGEIANNNEDENWDDPWPDKADYDDDPGIEIVEENKDDSKFVYESKNYRFICDVGLTKSVVGGFSEMFEASKLYAELLPLSINGGLKNNGKYDIFLFENYDDYVKEGGPNGSAGVFISGRNVVMVPLKSLGVRKAGSSYTRDRDKDNNTLIHEIIHQLTPNEYFEEGARGWFTEGLAEYCAMTPYRYGRFQVTGAIRQVEEDVTGFNRKTNMGRNLGEEFTAPDLKAFMMMDYSEFTGPRANFNYGFSALLATYFFHLDGNKDAARIKDFLKEIKSQRRERRHDPDAALAKLLDGRTWDEMEEDISKGWRSKGVKIEFK